MAGFTCGDWASGSAGDVGQVGHSDGMGPGQSTAGALASWNSSHSNQNCSNTAPAGRCRTLLLLRALAPRDQETIPVARTRCDMQHMPTTGMPYSGLARSGERTDLDGALRVGERTKFSGHTA